MINKECDWMAIRNSSNGDRTFVTSAKRDAVSGLWQELYCLHCGQKYKWYQNDWEAV